MGDSNGVYVGNVVIPYAAHDTSVEALIRIMTIEEKVASIELLFNNQFAYHFFVETFQERYYQGHNVRYSYKWDFKEQSVRVGNKTHEGLKETITNGKYNIERVDVYDATFVEYIHKPLYNRILEKAKKEKATKDSINKTRHDSIEKIKRREEKELKENI